MKPRFVLALLFALIASTAARALPQESRSGSVTIKAGQTTYLFLGKSPGTDVAVYSGDLDAVVDGLPLGKIPDSLISSSVFAAPVGSHTTVLSWLLSVDDDAGSSAPVNCVAAAGCAQNVYRAQGLCTSTTSFTLLTTTPLGATAATFTDSSVTPGNWCYGVTFTMNGLESSKDAASVSLQPSPPTGLSGLPH